MPDLNVVETPASATPEAPVQPVTTPQVTPQSATPTVTPAPATGAPPEGFVPSYRLRETRDAAIRQAQEAHAQEINAIRAEAERYKQQLHSLVGVTPPPDPEISGIRQQFSQVYPGLSKIEERAEEIMGILERAGDLESQNSHYWQTYGRQTMDRLFSHAAETLGAPLNDEAKRALHSSFVGFIQSSPELQARYSSDPTLVEDFWKAFSSSFIDPVRRTATTAAAGRAPTNIGIPQDTPGGVPRATPVPQPSNADERVANAWTQFSTFRK